MAVQRRSLSMMRGNLSQGLLGRSFSAAFLYYLFLTATLFALLLPLLGPIVDHHTAERQPYHAHIYFSSSGAQHVHFYEDGHSHVRHFPDSLSAPLTSPGDGPGSAGVMYLTSNDGLGQSSTTLATTSLHPEVIYPAPVDTRFLGRLGEEDGLPPESFVPPPKKPPRA